MNWTEILVFNVGVIVGGLAAFYGFRSALKKWEEENRK